MSEFGIKCRYPSCVCSVVKLVDDDTVDPPIESWYHDYDKCHHPSHNHLAEPDLRINAQTNFPL